MPLLVRNADIVTADGRQRGDIYAEGETITRIGANLEAPRLPGSDTEVIDAAGKLVWVRTWGDHDNDRGRAVALDAAGNPVVAGTYEFTIDLVTPSLSSVRADGDRIPKPDIFVIRFDR